MSGSINTEFDFVFNLALVGDSRCGKTDIMNRFCDGDAFIASSDVTIGVNVRSVNVETKGKLIKIQIIDTAGEKRFRPLTLGICEKVDGVLLVYDPSQPNTFHHLNQWIEDIDKIVNYRYVEKIILANDSCITKEKDHQDQRITRQRITRQQGEEFSRKHNSDFQEVSSHEGNNCSESILSFFGNILERCEVNEVSVKLVLIGDSHCGKSELMQRFCDSKANLVEKHVTAGIQCKCNIIQMNGTRLRLQTIDTSGHARHRQLSVSLCKGAYAIILVYDITQAATFSHLQNWVEDVDKFASQYALKMVLGNNSHLVGRREVSKEKAKRFAQKRGMLFYEVSSKEDINCKESFRSFLQHIVKQQENKIVLQKMC